MVQSLTKLAISSDYAKAVVCLLVVSAIFAIFTLALIPLVGEKITDDTESIYDLKGTFRPFRLWDTKWKYPLKDKEWSWPLKAVCWPQQVFFIAGIAVFAIGVLVKP